MVIQFFYFKQIFKVLLEEKIGRQKKEKLNLTVDLSLFSSFSSCQYIKMKEKHDPSHTTIQSPNTVLEKPARHWTLSETKTGNYLQPISGSQLCCKQIHTSLSLNSLPFLNIKQHLSWKKNSSKSKLKNIFKPSIFFTYSTSQHICTELLQS